MRHAARRGGDFAPAVHEQPPNEPARARVVAHIAEQRAKEQNDVLRERVELILQWSARAKKIPAEFAIHFQNETGLRLIIGVIRREKIGKQLSIFVNRIDRRTKKTSFTA